LSFISTSVSVNARRIIDITSKTTYATTEDCVAFATYRFSRSLFFLYNTPRNRPIRPYSTILAMTAPINAEYLAKGPRLSTACDSTSPGVSENKA
jgi:hypothetical protein